MYLYSNLDDVQPTLHQSVPEQIAQIADDGAVC